jgi:CHAD domain-containing protein
LVRALAEFGNASGWTFAPAGLDELDEFWLDTEDRRILRASLILRARNGARPIARLTPLGDAFEFVQTLDTGAIEDAVRDPGPVGTRVLALAGGRPLERHVELNVRTNVFEGSLGPSRIALHHETMRPLRPAPPGVVPSCRLTIVADGRKPAAFYALLASLQVPCGLAPVPPFDETARALAGIVPLPEPELGPENTSPGMTASALAFAGLRRHTRAFLRNEPGARLGDDPETLHDMRVATRRLRATFDLFEPYLPKRAGALRRELGRIGRILGAVRDLDVQLGQVAVWRKDGPAADAASFDAIDAVLGAKRAASRRRLLATLETVRYAQFLERLCAFVRRGPPSRGAAFHVAARAAAPELIGRRYRAVRRPGERLSEGSAPPDFHALRIRAKRLRYALELHRPICDGEVAAMIEKLTGLQDLLGEHQDAVMAGVQLETLSATATRRLSPRARFVMGTIAGRCTARAQALRRDFGEAFKAIRGRRWKRLKATLAANVP